MSYTSQCTVMSKIWETEMNFFDISWWHQPVEILHQHPTLTFDPMSDVRENS